MKAYNTTTLGTHRGAPRVWLQGTLPERAGFTPGEKFELVKYDDRIALRISANGDRTVSSKDVRGKAIPIIDINSKDALSVFEGLEELRVVLMDNEILILPKASDIKLKERTERLLNKLRTGEPLAIGALAFGGGILDHAMHTGFTDSGVASYLAFANEIREDLVEHAAQVNPTFTKKTVPLVAALQEIAWDEAAMSRVPKVDGLYAGIPCSGASVSGRAKRGLALPEEHPLVGHLIAPAIAFIAKVNPFFVVIENVPSYANTASAAILRTQLKDLGYNIHERELLATDFGDLEKRNRWCFVAVTRGCEVNLEELLPEPFAVRTVGDVLEPADAVEDRWSNMTGLKAKQERDIADGKGFRMQIYNGSETSIATLTKGITKNRSTDPKIQHPTNPDLLRIPKAVEHARLKGVPEELIHELSETTAHELLGQGICYRAFRALGKYLALQLKSYAETAKAFAYASASSKQVLAVAG